MRVFILANGEAPSEALAQRLAREHDLILATDGAAHRAAGLGVMPHIICGDFDSVVLEIAKQEFPQCEFAPTPDQDRADLEKAIGLAILRGATHISIAGAGGGRIDHMLANYALLLRYHKEIALRIVEDHSEVIALSGDSETWGAYQIATCPGDTLSIISPSGTARVTLKGVAWELEDYRLPIGTMGVSNLARGDSASVWVKDGTVFVCHLPQR